MLERSIVAVLYGGTFAVAAMRLAVTALHGRPATRGYRALGAFAAALWVVFYLLLVAEDWFGVAMDRSFSMHLAGRLAIGLTAAAFVLWGFLFDGPTGDGNG